MLHACRLLLIAVCVSQARGSTAVAGDVCQLASTQRASAHEGGKVKRESGMRNGFSGFALVHSTDLTNLYSLLTRASDAGHK